MMKVVFEPERAAQWSRKFRPVTSAEHRPKNAKRSQEVPMKSGRDPHWNSGKSQHMPSKEKHMARAVEMPVTESESPTGSYPSERSPDKILSPQSTITGASNPGVKVKPAIFDGSSSWLDYKTLFDMCAELNSWNAKQKGLSLAVNLRGEAQRVLGNLPAGDRQEFQKLVKALTEKFSPECQTERRNGSGSMVKTFLNSDRGS